MVYSSDRTITQLNELASGNIDVTNDEIPIWDVNAAAGQRTMKTKVVSLLSRVTTSMISGLDTALAARLQVFGNPTNGQVPKWNTANNRAEWAADATGAGVTAYNYVQQAVPSSPADDERWLELDSNGVPVEAWFYDLTNTRWLSIARYVNGTTLTNASASVTNRFNFAAPSGSGVLLIRVVHRVESTSNHSGTAFWSISMGVTNLAGTTAISGTTTFNTQTLVSASTSTFSENVAIVLPAGHNFAVSYNRTSTPANIWATTETTVRIIR